jgi:hypothetical protein
MARRGGRQLGAWPDHRPALVHRRRCSRRTNRVLWDAEVGTSVLAEDTWSAKLTAKHYPMAMADITAETFRDELSAQLKRAESRGASHVEINSGELHRKVGGYPGPAHRMPTCCEVMYSARQDGDEIVSSPEAGKGAALTIRYRLPRSRHA